MKNTSLVAVVGFAIWMVGFAETGTFSFFTPSPTHAAADDDVFTSENQWAVFEIAGSMWNMAADAGHFEAVDQFQVRNVSATRFSLTRRAEDYTVVLVGTAWDPDRYGKLAASILADGAGLSVSEDPFRDRGEPAEDLAAATPDVIALESARVTRLLHDHPRSAALHERAAFLLGITALRASGDPRPAMCRMTAHLAAARALHPSALPERRAADETLRALVLQQHQPGARHSYPSNY
jgi:hypothetical protein